MKGSLSIVFLILISLSGFSSAANCFYAMKQILLGEQHLLYAGGDILDSTVEASNGKIVERKMQWNGDFVSSITTNNSVTDDPFVKSGTSNIVVVHDEKELKNNGIEILSVKEMKKDTAVYLNTRYYGGTLFSKTRISLINDDVIIEDVGSGEPLNGYDKIEMLERKDTLFILGWKKVDGELSLYANQYFVVDENDPTSCTEWLVSKGVASETDYSNVIEPTESGYVFRRESLEDTGDYKEYFFEELKDTSVVESPKDTTIVEPSKDTTDVKPSKDDTTKVQSIVKRNEPAVRLKSRIRHVDLKGRHISKDKKNQPHRVLF